MKGILFLICVGFFSSNPILANVSDVEFQQDYSDTSKFTGPRKAAVMSAIIPGLGQLHNEKYWKVGVIYGGVGLLTWYYIRNRDSLNSYQRAYTARIDTSSVTIDNRYSYLSDAAVLSNRNFHRRQRDIAILGFAGLYLLQIIDANVDAHLKEFEVNKDLSLKVKPEFSGLISHDPTFNLKLTFRF